jgi:hypothetical protein
MKTCKQCLGEFGYEMFYKHSGMTDGHLNFCKKCFGAKCAAYRKKNIDRIRAYDRERAKLPHRLELTAKGAKKRRARSKLYGKAHSKVSRAVSSGKMVRADCERCGRSAGVHAHHDDYSKPLDVMWLCPPCHSERHKELEKAGISPWPSEKS